MAIVLEEKTESRRWLQGVNPTVEYLYFLTGTADDAEAHAYVEANTPASVAGLPRLTFELEADWVDILASGPGDGRWNVIVTYGLLSPTESGETIFTFDTTGGTQHVTQSIATIRSASIEGVSTPDHKGTIGVTADGADGVDIQVAVYNFSETHFLADTVVDNPYKGVIFTATGRVNNADFKGFSTGEVLFLGCRGAKRGNGIWEMNFGFAALPNRTTPIVIGGVTIPVGGGGQSKWGWEYLWVLYHTTTDGPSNVRRPKSAYIEKVYETTDLGLLDIGI